MNNISNSEDSLIKPIDFKKPASRRILSKKEVLGEIEAKESE